MSIVLTRWRRLPVVLRAVLAGLFVTFLGEAPWAFLARANVKLSPAIPWAVVAMGLWLYLYWRYFGGAGWPEETKAARRDNMCRLALPGTIWLWSLVSGGLAVMSLIALELIVLRMVHSPAGAQAPTLGIPVYTLLALAIMSALASGIPEELGFRGYMQVPLERRYGAPFAVLFVAVLFGLSHLNHGVSVRILFDFAFGLVFGVVAWLANSLLPGMILHCAGDVVLFVAGRRIGAALAARPLTGTAGLDALFWGCLVAFVGLSFGAFFGLRHLAETAHSRPATLA